MYNQNGSNSEQGFGTMSMSSGLARPLIDRDPQQLSVEEIEVFRRLIAVLGGLVEADSRRSEKDYRTDEAEGLGRRQKTTIAVTLPERITEVNQSQNLSQCPGCGGCLEGSLRKCVQCEPDSSEAATQRKSHQKHEFSQRLTREQRTEPEREKPLSMSTAELKAELDAVTKGTLDRCPKCHRRRPGTKPPRATTPREVSSTMRHAVRWARTMKTDRCCPSCVNRRHSRKSRMITAFRRVSRVMKSSFWLYAVLPAFVLCILAAVLILNL